MSLVDLIANEPEHGILLNNQLLVGSPSLFVYKLPLVFAEALELLPDVQFLSQL